MIESAMNSVWETIANEIHHRRKNEAWLARQLCVGRNTVNGWKRRGVPASRHEQIAELFGWTIEHLICGVDAPTAAPAPSPENYSPMALSLAKIFDEIQDESQRLRAFTLAVQIFTLGGFPLGFFAPTPPAHGATAPVAQSSLAPHIVK